jgi:hypothetical protein
MKLSNIQTATHYPITIPSTGKSVKFRPFLVKEEKALLVAQESEETAVQLATLDSVVKQCLVGFEGELTTYDLEYLFIMIRSKSVGEISEVIAACKHCGEKNEFGVDLTKAEVTNLGQDKKLKLSDDLIVVMQHPTVEQLAEISTIADETEKKFRTIGSSIKTVYYKDEVFHVEESEPAEIIAFLDNRSDQEFNKIDSFLKEIPTVVLKSSYKCLHCSKMNEFTLTTLSDFF